MGGQRIPEQLPEKRLKNFGEVSLGYNKKQALEEARRCPQCSDAPCLKGCPLGIDIPGFIRAIRETNMKEALERIKEQNKFASICGRVCSRPCEEACILKEEGSPINIRALERYAADSTQDKTKLKKKGDRREIKIAVVGSGPAGLSAAVELALKGYNITVFESLHALGGVLRYGIPEFRLPDKTLDAIIKDSRSLGIEFKTDVLVGQTLGLEELFKSGFSVVFLAPGAGTPSPLGIPGEDALGVLYAEEFLMRMNLFKANLFPKYDTQANIGQRIAVIGENNAALDCARIVVRLGKEATLITQGTEEAIDVSPELKEHAKQEGVRFDILTKPIEVIRDGRKRVRGLKCLQMDYADPEESGEWRLIPVKGSEFVLEVDTIISSTGHRPSLSMSKWIPQLRFNKNTTVWISRSSFSTSIPGVFAAGNAVSASGHLVSALEQAKRAAVQIEKYLEEQFKDKRK